MRDTCRGSSRCYARLLRRRDFVSLKTRFPSRALLIPRKNIMTLPLKVTNLRKSYSAKSGEAVKGISFELKQGEILGLLGPNGAGKTTTINMLLGTLTPSSGEILYFGKNFAADRSSALQHIGYASAYNRLHWRLSVMENLNIYRFIYGMEKEDYKKRVAELLEYFRMTEFKDRSFNSLSAGQATRVLLIKAFLPRPKIIFLDEPTASLDPDIALEVRRFILDQQKNSGASILYTSHNMEEVADICNRVIFLKEGEIIACDEPAKLAAGMKDLEVEMLLDDNFERLIATLVKLNIRFENQSGKFCFSIKHDELYSVLEQIISAGNKFKDLQIHRPTLESYFLQIAGVRK